MVNFFLRRGKKKRCLYSRRGNLRGNKSDFVWAKKRFPFFSWPFLILSDSSLFFHQVSTLFWFNNLSTDTHKLRKKHVMIESMSWAPSIVETVCPSFRCSYQCSLSVGSSDMTLLLPIDQRCHPCNNDLCQLILIASFCTSKFTEALHAWRFGCFFFPNFLNVKTVISFASFSWICQNSFLSSCS